MKFEKDFSGKKKVEKRVNLQNRNFKFQPKIVLSVSRLEVPLRPYQRKHEETPHEGALLNSFGLW